MRSQAHTHTPTHTRTHLISRDCDVFTLTQNTAHHESERDTEPSRVGLPACMVSLSCVRLHSPVTCSPPGSSVPGILQARTLEGVAMPSSRGSSRPRDQTRFSLHLLHWQADSVPPAPPGKPTSVGGLFSLPCPKPQLSPLSTPVPQVTLRFYTLKQHVAPTLISFQHPQGGSRKHLEFSETCRILGNDDQICYETKLKDAPVCKHGGK